jgi:hypothetical protein
MMGGIWSVEGRKHPEQHETTRKANNKKKKEK